MKNDKLLQNLKSLCQLDLDAIEAYEQAIEKVDLPDVRSNLQNFRADHLRHVSDLTAAIQRFGGQAPVKPDIKGYLLEGLTALRSVTGTAGALKAMKTNEELTNKSYRQALDAAFQDESARSLIARNFADEQRHLSYIKQCINEKIWDRTDVGVDVPVERGPGGPGKVVR